VVCDILLESSQWGLRHCFRPHLNRRSTCKIMGPQSRKSPNCGNFGTKWHLGFGPMARHRVYYKGEGGDFPQVRVVVNLVSSCLPVARPCTKVLQLCTNQLIVWFVQVCVSNWCLSLFLVPILELQQAFLPPKCYEPQNMLQFFILPLFSLQTHIWVYQGA